MQLPPTKEINRSSKPGPVMSCIYGWAGSNMFCFRLWDGIIYSMLYILAPIFITWISLQTLQEDLVVAAYSYFSIMISAASCFHDALGRFERKRKSVKNIKLKIILASSIIAFGYSFFQFLASLIGKTLEFRNDAVLYLYLPAVAIAAIDIITLFGREDCIVDAVKN